MTLPSTTTSSASTMTSNETDIITFLADNITKTILNANASTTSVGASYDDADADDYADYNLTDIFGPKRDPLYVVIPITCIYMAIFVTGVVGNISTCVVIARNRSMHTATNYYLFSLAISDFLLLIAGVPQEMYLIWSKYPYVFGELFCVLRGMAAEAAANATVLTITAFTVERYVAICHPFLSHTMSKLSRAVRLIGVVWLCSIAMAVPQALQFGVVTIAGVAQCDVTRIIIAHSFEVSTFVFFVGPMTLITVLYVLIGLKLRSASLLMPRASGSTLQRRTTPNSTQRQQTSQGTKRVLKMLVAVVVAFFLCWAPFHAQRLVAIYGSGNEHLDIYVVMTYVSGILYYLSTCINPLLYNLMSNKFREAFKETLATCCRPAARANDSQRAYRVLSRSQRTRTGRNESTDYSGSSMRDEVYSTVAQKPNVCVDTMTPPAKAPLLPHANVNGANNMLLQCLTAMPAAQRRMLPLVIGPSGTAAGAAANGRSAPADGTAIANTFAADPNDTGLPGHQFVELTSVTQITSSSSSDSIRAVLASTSSSDAASAASQLLGHITQRRRLLKRLQQLPNWRWHSRPMLSFGTADRAKRTAYHSPPLEQHRLSAMGCRGDVATRGRAIPSKLCVDFEDVVQVAQIPETPPNDARCMRRAINAVPLPIRTQSAVSKLGPIADTTGAASDGVVCDELSAYMNELRQREMNS